MLGLVCYNYVAYTWKNSLVSILLSIPRHHANLCVPFLRLMKKSVGIPGRLLWPEIFPSDLLHSSHQRADRTSLLVLWRMKNEEFDLVPQRNSFSSSHIPLHPSLIFFFFFSVPVCQSHIKAECTLLENQKFRSEVMRISSALDKNV